MTKILSALLCTGALLMTAGCGCDRAGGCKADAAKADAGCKMACCTEAKAAGKTCDKCGCAKPAPKPADAK